jgi:hypothetical protein
LRLSVGLAMRRPFAAHSSMFRPAATLQAVPKNKSGAF